MRRTQIFLEDDQTARLDHRASAEGVTRSTLIRRAVDEYLTRDDQDPEAWRARWQDTLRDTAGTARDRPDGAAYVEGLRTADAERLRDLER